jgi:Family of unknown function (DUF5829)
MRLLGLAMLTVASTAAADLNHFYLALDHETYAAIEGSDFLKSQFATFEQRTTVRSDITYTAIYFYGTHTYFEFFGAAGEPREPGESAIGFGVDTAGAEPIMVPSGKQLITRESQGVQLPWFYMLSGAGRPPGLVVWLMEYHPDFLSKWHPDAGGPPSGITREAVLRRYKAVLPNAITDPMMEDVVALTVAALPEEREAVEPWIRDVGSNVPVRFVERPGEHGIREVRFKLRRAPAKVLEMHFGAKSVLRLQPDGTGFWTF